MATLGFGFEAYWRMLYSMTAVFFILTIVFIPVMGIYYEGGALAGMRNGMNSVWTLGNLGFSKAVCIS